MLHHNPDNINYYVDNRYSEYKKTGKYMLIIGRLHYTKNYLDTLCKFPCWRMHIVKAVVNVHS